MKISKFTFILFVVNSLIACGGGGGSDGGSAVEPEVPVIRDVQLNGSASVGAALTGLVAVYPVTEEGVSRAVDLAGDLITDSDGTFSLTIVDLEADAIYIEVESDDRPLRCGIEVCERDANGNPEKQFGDEYTPRKKITLGGIISVRNSNRTAENLAVTRAENSNVSIQAHLNAFTELAAKLAQNTSGTNLVDAGNEANAKVRNRFRLTDDLFISSPVSLVTSDSVNAAAKANFKRELKSAGLLGAGLDSSGNETIADSLALIANQFSSSGIADTELSPSTNTITVEKSLAKANAILVNKVSALPDVDTTTNNFTEVKSELVGEEKFAQNGSTEPSQGEASPDQGLTGLAAVKAFSAQIRNFANVVDGASPSQEALNFEEELNTASQIASIDAGIIDSGLAMGLNAIRFAYEAYDADNTTTENTYENITVAITKNGSNVKYAVAQIQNIDGSEVNINLTATDYASYNNSTESNPTPDVSDNEYDIDVKLGVSGSVTNEKLELQIFDNNTSESILAFKLESTEYDTDSQNGYTDEEDTTVSSASADLQVVMTQRENTADDPITFTGSLVFSLSNFRYTEDGSTTYSNSGNISTYEENSTETFDLDAASFTLSGKITSNSGKLLSATTSVSINNLHTICTSSYFDEYNYNSGQYSSIEDDDCDSANEESESNFVGVSISILLNLDLPALADDAKLEISGSRTGLDTATVSVYALYDGQVLDIDFNYNDNAPNSVTISNQNQAILTLNESETGVVSGFMTKDGLRYADVDEDSGIITISYSDGSFESFM